MLSKLVYCSGVGPHITFLIDRLPIHAHSLIFKECPTAFKSWPQPAKKSDSVWPKWPFYC